MDLDGYTSVESADDIDALREARGYEKIDLWGVGYGTHLGLATIRRYGDRIERAILMGVEGPGHTYQLPSTMDVQWSKIVALAARDSGTMDFNTPPCQAEEVRSGFTNAAHIIVEGAGHEQVINQRPVQVAIAAFLRGEDVADARVDAGPIRCVPIVGYDPQVTHPSVPRP